MVMLSSKGIRNLDWGLILALVIGLVASASFITRPGLPHQTDAELHVYRAAELGHLLKAGAFYPRWAPDLYLGYGYPIFNYYAPMVYYLANLFALPAAVSIVAGTKAVFILGLLCASCGAYLLGRELFGSASGVLSAAAFVFSPYVVFIDPHARGDLAEHFAIALLPLVFYFFHRLLTSGGRWVFVGSVLSLASVVFSHNLIGLVVAVLIFAYWLWVLLLERERHQLLWGPLAFAISAALIAFFWLPFLLERDAIKLNVVGSGHFDFRNHFLTLRELLAPSRILDMAATAPHYRTNFGVAQWALGLLALAVLARAALRQHWSRPVATLGYYVLAAGGLTFLMLPLSTPVWEMVAGMEYLQFPWRLLGPASLMLSVCAGGGLSLLPETGWKPLASAGAVTLVLVLALPVLYPPMWDADFGGTAPENIIAWEVRSHAFGTTSTGDFLPVEAALVMMKPMPSLVDSYAADGPVDRVNRAVLPGGASVEIVEQRPGYDRFRVVTPKGFVFRNYTFYFPGWHVYIDGQEVAVDVAGPEGFITFWVPAGEHEVVVRFEDTPPRTIGWLISAGGLAGLLLAIVFYSPSEEGVPSRRSDRSLRAIAWMGGAVALFIAVKSLVIDPQDDCMRYTSPPGEALAAQHQTHVNFENQIELLGYDLPQRQVRAGKTFPVTLYWRALQPLETNYQSFVHVARPLHVLWGQRDHLNPGGLPTRQWPLDRYVWDEYTIQVLPGTPPGEYQLNVGLPSWAGGFRLKRVRADGDVIGDSVVIDTIHVLPPLRQPSVSALDLAAVNHEPFSEKGLTLLGYSLPEAPSLTAPWSIVLYWRADHASPSARTRALVLLNDRADVVWRVSGVPAVGHYPFGHWGTKSIVRDPVVVADLPEGLSAGIYDLALAIDGENLEEGRELRLIGSIELR